MHLRVSFRMSALLLSAGLVVAAAACGSSNNNSGTAATTTAAPTTTAITKAAFVEQANALCKELNASSTGMGSPTNAAEAAAVMTKGAEILQATLTKIKALPQPTEDSAALQAAYADADNLISLANQTAAALNAGNSAEAQSLASQIDGANAKANASFNAYGMTECGKGGSSSSSTTAAP